MTLAPKAACSSWFGKFLSGKDKGDVGSFIAKRHTVRKRILSCRPSDVDTQGFINRCPCGVERLVLDCLNHPSQLRLRPIARHFRDEPDNPWHALFSYEVSVTDCDLRLYQAVRYSRIFASTGSGTCSVNF
jgi:hypothetical protein